MLNYEISGTGNEILVLLHGFMENNLIWEDMEPYLHKKFKLIKIDLPGHGRSDAYSDIHSMELMAEKVKEVTLHLNLPQFHLLGHSMGGYVSLAFAEQFSEDIKSLTLFFSTYFPDDEEKKENRRKGFRIIKDNMKPYVSTGVPLLFNPNEKNILKSKIELAKEIALNTKPESAIAAQKGMMERVDKKELIANLDAKIIIISGKYDNAVDTKQLIKYLPDKTNIKSYILDCGHNGHWEKPEICATILNTELLHNLPNI